MTIALIVLGIFCYITIGAFMDYLLDLDNNWFIFIWPIGLVIVGGIWLGFTLGEWFKNAVKNIKEGK